MFNESFTLFEQIEKWMTELRNHQTSSIKKFHLIDNSEERNKLACIISREIDAKSPLILQNLYKSDQIYQQIFYRTIQFEKKSALGYAI
jgi:hypothetical protein